MTAPILGIDFGTCRTSGAVFLGGKCEVVDLGTGVASSKDMPTALFLRGPDAVLVGDRAVASRPQAVSRYWEDFKRRVGSFDRFELDGCSYAPEDLVGLVLHHVKERAQEQFSRSEPIVEAVLTVPTTYVEGGDAWKAMEEAGRLAGFETVHLVREPDAAALYYDSLVRGRGSDLQKEGELTLVYDLGGGTFDPGLIRREGSGYRVLRGPQDAYGVACGGNHFDRLVFQHFSKIHPRIAETARQVLSGKDEQVDRRDVKDAMELHRFLVDVKAHLSSEVVFDGEEPTNGEPYTLDRATFEAMISPLLDQTVSCCESLVDRCEEAEWSSITRILLVGGSSKIPLVEKKLDAMRRLHRCSAELYRGRIGTGTAYYSPELAVSHGAAIAGVRLSEARLLQQGMSAFLVGPSPSHDAEAFRCLLAAGSAGAHQAWYPLGVLYAQGRGTTVDFAEAVKWYRKAADAGVADAQAALGGCYRLGKGVGQDAEQAKAWYRKAVEQGHAKARESLRELEEDNPEGWYAKGEKYRTGQGVAVDMAEAAKWYRKAAEGGQADAQFWMGFFCANGHGIVKDEGAAFRWYSKAAEQGNRAAQGNLGVCYHNGLGVSKDVDSAKFWYRKAIAQGDDQAKKNLAILETPPPPPPPKSCIVPGTNKGTFTDPRDGRVYRAVKIGKQVWMAENLAFNIPGSWAYGNNSANEVTYGRLYTWDAAKVACPPGWHLPTDEEWMELETAVGMNVAKAKETGWRKTNDEGTRLKARSGWKTWESSSGFLGLTKTTHSGNGTDDDGFLVLPAGIRARGSFHYLGSSAHFWSASSDGSSNSWRRVFHHGEGGVYRVLDVRSYGCSVRLLEN